MSEYVPFDWYQIEGFGLAIGTQYETEAEAYDAAVAAISARIEPGHSPRTFQILKYTSLRRAT